MTAPSSPTHAEEGLVVASAPGRVNLMGDHTDYNFGFVLPVVIPQRTRAWLRPRGDDRVSLESSQMPGAAHVYRLGSEAPTGAWTDYVQGLTAALHRRALLRHGFDLTVSSDVPVGAGLSSSAALAVAVLRALRSAFALPLGDLELAQVAQEAEVSFVGVPVGIMDPMAASLGEPGSALLIDTRALTWQHVPLPPDLEVVVIASGITHAHSDNEYKVRHLECEEAAQQLGVKSLRELSEGHDVNTSGLAPHLARRVRHVLSENARVLATVAALRERDRAQLRALFAQSHLSMRDDFEVSTPEIDLLVGLSERESCVFGARLTGGGFGGSVVMLAARDRAFATARTICLQYAEKTGREPALLHPQS